MVTIFVNFYAMGEFHDDNYIHALFIFYHQHRHHPFIHILQVHNYLETDYNHYNSLSLSDHYLSIFSSGI